MDTDDTQEGPPHIYHSSTGKIKITISMHDYQDYWQSANKKTSSSFSPLHFGHYKATSYSTTLSSLHAAKLAACGRMGIPLA
jgi:hypothetical protein